MEMGAIRCSNLDCDVWLLDGPRNVNVQIQRQANMHWKKPQYRRTGSAMDVDGEPYLSAIMRVVNKNQQTRRFAQGVSLLAEKRAGSQCVYEVACMWHHAHWFVEMGGRSVARHLRPGVAKVVFVKVLTIHCRPLDLERTDFIARPELCTLNTKFSEFRCHQELN